MRGAAGVIGVRGVAIGGSFPSVAGWGVLIVAGLTPWALAAADGAVAMRRGLLGFPVCR